MNNTINENVESMKNYFDNIKYGTVTVEDGEKENETKASFKAEKQLSLVIRDMLGFTGNKGKYDVGFYVNGGTQVTNENIPEVIKSNIIQGDKNIDSIAGQYRFTSKNGLPNHHVNVTVTSTLNCYNKK